MDFLKDKLDLRLYQQAILGTAAQKNALVVLPTGLGKTHIAIGLAALRLPLGRILVMAPTKPLIDQHLKTFLGFFAPAEKMSLLTGKTPVETRISMWQNSLMIFATPQTVRNDILAGRANLKDFSLVVFDEAHRAVGNYAYVFLAKTYLQQSATPKILALTASPGSDEEYIKQVCANLFVDCAEIRDRESPDVKPYVKKLVTEYKLIPLSDEIINIRKLLQQAMKSRLEDLKSLGHINIADTRRVTRKDLLALQVSLQARLLQKDYNAARALSITAALMKLGHANSLLESESLAALEQYFKDMWAAAKLGKTRAVKDIVSDFHVRNAYLMTQTALERGAEHPKLCALKEIVERQFSQNPKSKIIVFTEFRNNIQKILETISTVPGVNAHKFIGQASKSDAGMPQATQIEVLERFKRSEINVLVCTAVAEEGLDVPQVDLVVLYTPVPSAIRAIQRRGRTGRQSAGKLAILVAKDTRDEAYYWVAKHREAAMADAVRNLNRPDEQPKLDEFIKPESNITVFADSREQGPVADMLYAQGIVVKQGILKSGDFIISEDVGIERKTVSDFVNSLIDGRLFEQAKNLKSDFVRPMYIVEGNLKEMFSARNVKPQAIWAAMLSLIVDWKIPVLFSSGAEETAALIVAAARREQVEGKKQISVREERKPKIIPEMQQFLVEGLPGIGPIAARSLLKQFGTPAKVLSASLNELQAVGGIGPKKAELIKKILETEFKSEPVIDDVK
ncbi:MAG: DEAD/DEAH box helicase [archaeon]